jgi:glycosyltransferase involved in cell wall biosynthesis
VLVRESRRIPFARVNDLPRLLLAAQPLDGGVARHVVTLVDALPPGRFAVHVACPRRSLVWSSLAGRDDVTLHAIHAGRPISPGDAATLATLTRLVASADVVHGHSSKAGFLVRLAAAMRGRRRTCLFTPHAWSFWAASGAERAFYLRLERVAAHWCRTIVALSQAERAAGLEAGVGRPEQYRVIPNGIDLVPFDAPPAPVPNRVVMVGRLAPQKRPDVAVRALAAARRTVPDAELHIVGDGPLAASVESLAAELGLDGAVRLLGPRDDVPELLRSAACLLLSSDYEGCPLTVIEAMAAGAPVVATSSAGLGELVEDGRTGLLAPPGNPEALGAALTELLRDRERASRLGMAGREVARERLSAARMAAETVELYDEVLRTGRATSFEGVA